MESVRSAITEAYRKAWNLFSEDSDGEIKQFDPVLQDDEIVAVEDWIMFNLREAIQERPDLIYDLARSMAAPYGCPLTLLTHNERIAVFRSFYKTESDQADSEMMIRRQKKCISICLDAIKRGRIQQFYQDAFGGAVYMDAKATTARVQRSVLKGGA